MTQPRRGLGRGLDALFGLHNPPEPGAAPADEQPGDAATATAERVSGASRRGLETIDIDLIAPNPEQPRTNFEPEQLRELADSIREHGIIQPLIVSRAEDGGYRLIAGERRLQAARLAGIDRVPVVTREVSGADLLALALVENIQRADLNAIEEAMAYRRLIDEHGLTQEEAARQVGKSRVTVANALRLLQLEPEIRRSLVAGEITEGHARALLGLPEGRGRLDAWGEVARRGLSVRETEALVRKLVAEPAKRTIDPPPIARKDPDVADVEGRLRRALSTRVTVSRGRKGAKIVIECFSAEEFDSVVHQLLGDEA